MKKAKGVAILIVLVALALLSAVAVQISTKETVRYKLVLNDLNALKAESLAQSGFNFAMLLLLVQEPLQDYLTKFASLGVPLPAYTVWDLMPMDSNLLLGITEGSFVPNFGIEGMPKTSENKVPQKKEYSFIGDYESPENGFGGFEGSFTTIIEDEEKKYSIKKWFSLPSNEQKQLFDSLLSILEQPKYRSLFDGTFGQNNNIDAKQLLANIYDYISPIEFALDPDAPDESFGRDNRGSKLNSYAALPNIKPKNSYFDSMGEIRLVPGVNDAIFYVLSKYITIYGESNKINLLSASDDMISHLFQLCVDKEDKNKIDEESKRNELMSLWNEKKAEGKLILSDEGLINHLKEANLKVDEEFCKSKIGTSAKTFTIRSIATVGQVTKTVVAKVRSAAGIFTIYQYQYL